jgi:hypothetical protein
LPDAPLSVWSLVWSPDSRLVAAHGSARLPVVRDRSARNYTLVWDVTSGKRVPHLDLPDDQSWRQFCADGRTILTTGPAGVTLWEVVTGRERLRLPARDAAALALSNDGRVLVTGGGDTQVLVWDLSGGHKEQALSAEQRRAAGEALAGGDAQAAYAALWQLVADPAGAITLLQEQLRPVKVRVDEKELSSLIARLGSDDFVDRQRATQQLETHGELALPALRQARQGSLSLEARRRVDGLLDKLDENRLHGVTLRGVRGVEVLERLGTAPARRLLNALAAGTPEARLTREAQAALARLAHAP